jgi:hypothetical protein
MNKHQGSIKPALLAAAITATVLASAANGQVASTAGGSGTVKAAPVAQDQRTPVVLLTETMGDLGFEIFDGQTPRYGFATMPKNVKDGILYIDVDSLELNPKKTQAALKLARDRNWVVMAESGTWDVPRLHAFLAAHLPRMNTKGLKNVAVRIGWDKGHAVATDLTPSEAAVEVGIDYLQTSEGNAFAENTWRGNSMMSTRTVAPDSYYAWFANAAYTVTPADRMGSDGKYYKLTVNKDVVKVWVASGTGPGASKHCLVAWKGSTWKDLGGDWARNIENQFGVAVNWTGETGNEKLGHGYVSRLKNHKKAIDDLNCRSYIVTGHSLGGGMAQAHAYTIRSKLPRLEAYNSARAGNTYFRSTLHRALGVTRIKIFCRTGDPIPGVPVGLINAGFSTNGCVAPFAARASWINPAANHSMALWL